MATEEIPAWKYWHPLALWKVLAIFGVTQIVAQIGFGALFSALAIGGGANVGAGVGGGVGFIVVWKLAQKARASEPSESDGD